MVLFSSHRISLKYSKTKHSLGGSIILTHNAIYINLIVKENNYIYTHISLQVYLNCTLIWKQTSKLDLKNSNYEEKKKKRK